METETEMNWNEYQEGIEKVSIKTAAYEIIAQREVWQNCSKRKKDQKDCSIAGKKMYIAAKVICDKMEIWKNYKIY